MSGGQVRWTLVFTTASLDHLAERNIDAADVADAVYGRHGPVRVRRTGRGSDERWFVVAPVEGGALLTCVFRAARARDLGAAGGFCGSGTGRSEPPTEGGSSMRGECTGAVSVVAQHSKV